MKHHLKKALYVQFKTFGDVLVSTAIVKKLRERMGENSCIDYYTSPVCLDLLAGNPNIMKFYTPISPPVEEDYDVVYRPYRCLQTSCGWHSSGKHFMDLYAEACGVDLGGVYQPEFFNASDIDDDLKQFLKDTVLIQCKTNDSAKDWHPEHFARLVGLLSSAGYKAVQIGGKDDPAIPGTSQNLCGKVSFSQVATIAKNCLVTICLDSAIQHLAAAIGAPYIALYGAKESKLVRSGIPPIDACQVAIDPDERFGCEGACYMADCFRKTKCIDTIRPAAVMETVKGIEQWSKLAMEIGDAKEHVANR